MLVICIFVQRLPKAVHNDIGKDITTKLMFKCEHSVWKCTYDSEKMRFKGLQKFMRYYRVTIFSMLKFDYYGDDMFKVTIFKPNAIESKRPMYDFKDFVTYNGFQTWNPEEFMFDGSSLEFQKNLGIWAFNSYRNYPEYYSMRVYSFDIDKRKHELVRNNLSLSVLDFCLLYFL